MATRKRPQAEDKRGSILQAAQSICQEQGAAALRMDSVAAASGVAKGTLYLYFATKEDLLTALAGEELQVWAGELAKQIRAAKEAGSRSLGRILAGSFGGSKTLGPGLVPYVSAGFVEDSTREVVAGALTAVLPELDAHEAAKLWRAICALYRGYSAERREGGDFEEALANQIRGAVRGQKSKKRER